MGVKEKASLPVCEMMAPVMLGQYDPTSCVSFLFYFLILGCGVEVREKRGWEQHLDY